MSTSAAGILAKLREHDLRVFTTTDVITLLGMKKSAASQALGRLSRQGLLAKIRKGLWLNTFIPDSHPYELIPALTAPWPSYVSLQTALADHGLISEIPSILYGVTAGRAGRFQTPQGSIRLHHLPAGYIWGYSVHRVGKGHYLLAEPEKALLDTAYLSLVPRAGVHLPPPRPGRRRLDRKKLLAYAKRFHHSRLLPILKTHHWL